MIGDNEVRIAVVIHVGDRDVVGEMASGKRGAGCGMECAAAVAEEGHDGAIVGVVAAGIGDNDVGIAVVIDVGDCDPARTGAGWNRDGTE